MNRPLLTKTHKIHVFESFAGAYAGWKHACRFLQDHFSIPFQTVGLEFDLSTCVAYAMSHNASIIDPKTAHAPINLAKADGDFIIHASLEDDAWVPMVSEWGVHLMSISSPCQPYSNASKGLGLDSDQGCLLPSAILRCRILRPIAVMIEQVNGFSTHRHKTHCLQVLKAVGYKLIWQRTLDASEFGSVSRLRWLALAVHRNSQEIEPVQCESWPQIVQLFPQMLDALFPEPIPQSMQLTVTEKMLACAKDTCFLPPFMKHLKNASGQEVLHARMVNEYGVIPTIMAMYGQQHELDRSTLEKKGYYGHFFGSCEENLRFLHPAEIQMCHITYGEAFVENDFKQAWKNVGNMICCPHATLLLTNALNLLKIVDKKLSMHEVFDALFQNRLKASECRVVTGSFATMFVRKDDNSCDWDLHMRHYDEFCKNEECVFQLPEGKAWSPSIGLFNSDCKPQPSEGEASQISQCAQTEVDAISDTMKFNPLLRIKVETAKRLMIMWAYADVSPHDLSCHFNGKMTLEDSMDSEDGFAFILKHQVSFQEMDHPEQFASPCLKEDALIFIKLERIGKYQEQLDKLNLESVRFDQFGIISVGQKLYHDTMFFDFRISHQELDQYACMILAAFLGTQMSFQWSEIAMQFNLSIQGEEIQRKTLERFWTQIFSQASAEALQISVHAMHLPSITEVTYQMKHPFPPDAFALLLAVVTNRALLDTLVETGAIRVVLKWKGKTLWDGTVSQSLNVQTLIALLQIGFFPILLGKNMRLVYKAKQYCDVTIGELAQNNANQSAIFQLVAECSGGTGTKESQRAYVRNSLAATLLEQGFSIDWVAPTTETIMSKVGLKQTTAITQLPPGKQRVDSLLKICDDCGLTPPPKMTRAVAKTAQAGETRARKKIVVQIDPNEYQIEPSFFLAQNDQPLMQQKEIRHKSTGVVMLSYESAAPWIAEGQRITADELAMIIPGQHEIQGSLKHEIMNIPCKDSAMRPVILKATVVQLGEKCVKTMTSEKPAIDEMDCTTIAITLWKEDWQTEEWSHIVDHPFAFVRQTLASQGHDEILQATWGRSLRNQKQQTTSQHATSLQFHATIQTDKLRALLTTSGFNKIWITPKDRMGRLDSTWRVIWIEGSLPHLNSLASKTNGCAGLVKNRTSMGLRFSAVDFDQAWGVLFPGKPTPKPHDVNMLFHAQSLPYGCNADMLRKWGEQLNWDIHPIKALGPNAWLIGSKVHPPPGILTFNSKPVLLKHLPPKDATAPSPIVAGPKPLKSDAKRSTNANEQFGMQGDPWAPAAQQKGLPPAFANTGPSETKFKEQDAKIDEQNVKIQRMNDALEKLTADTKQEFLNVQEREKQSQLQMHTAIQAVKSDLESAFQNAIQQQSVQLNGTLGELRALLQAKPKRARANADGDMEDD